MTHPDFSDLPPGTPVPAGPLRDDPIFFEFAVYLEGELPVAAGGRARALLSERLAHEFGEDVVVDRLDPALKLPLAAFDARGVEGYAPPDEHMLRYKGRGLDDDARRRVAGCRSVVIVRGVAAGPDADRFHRGLLAAVHDLAVELDGFCWDESTREVFVPWAWRERRLGWQGGPPDVVDHVAMHAYRDGELIRIVTLGMSKFGLPEVAVREVPQGLSGKVGNLINLLCQGLVERPVLRKAGELPVALDRVESTSQRATQDQNILGNAERGATLTLVVGRRDEGDAENRLIDIAFGDPSHAQREQHAVIARIYGSEDELTPVPSDDADMERAMATARAEFAELRTGFHDGGTPDPGEQLLVKAAFDTDDGGVEWMWVEVVALRDGSIHGILANDPFGIEGLTVGDRVEVEVDAVGDYIYRRGDGTDVGNHTAAVLERRQRDG
jgi:uncharacterized protein YegJ (DUF2314 family)